MRNDRFVEIGFKGQMVHIDHLALYAFLCSVLSAR